MLKSRIISKNLPQHLTVVPQTSVAESRHRISLVDKVSGTLRDKMSITSANMSFQQHAASINSSFE